MGTFSNGGIRLNALKGSRLLVFFCAILTACGNPTSQRIAETDTALDSSGAGHRLPTYYSAKQAYARLLVYLGPTNSGVVLWRAAPGLTESFTHEQPPFLKIAGWVFDYRRADGTDFKAVLNCWGEVNVQPAESDITKGLSGPIPSEGWVLDDIDAHKLALEHGARALDPGAVGYLRSEPINGRGVRPVWGRWSVNVDGTSLGAVIDAQTGEIYIANSGSGFSGGFRALSSTRRTGITEWDGGYDEKSTSAQVGRTEHPDWWPWAYASRHLPWAGSEMGRVVYDRRLLRVALNKISERERTASSWETSGVLRLVLGEWKAALDDLTRAVDLSPASGDYRYYRGYVSMLIRDFGSAKADFEHLPPDYERFLKNVFLDMAVYQGTEKSQGFSQFLVLNTDVGKLPLEAQTGPLVLAVAANK